MRLVASDSNVRFVMGAHRSKLRKIGRVLSDEKYLILLCLPVVAHLVIFSYIPLYGVLIAFRDFKIGDVFFSLGNWVGLGNFERFFKSMYAYRLLRNTILLNVYGIIFGFPIPIVFAIFLDQIGISKIKKVYQTISYLPNFISTVIICGLIVNMLSSGDGIINRIIYMVSGQTIDFFLNPKYFRPIYIISGIWQSFGWNSIIYLAAISSIDVQMYESAEMDGASRLQRIIYITFPSIIPTISILFLLNLAGILNVGPDKILLLYSPAIYETSDVISTYLYRMGFLGSQYSYGTAIGLMNSLISLILMVSFNKMAQKLNLASLW